MAATQPSAMLSSGSLLGRYEILAKVAAGGMAEVYAARVRGALGFSRLVAVKVLHQSLVYEDQFISMFLDEARLAARIRHPNVVATVDLGESGTAAPFLVMEYIEGDHLGKLLREAAKRGERLPIPVTLRIMCDALGGLSAAHALRDEQGKWLQLVHRDVSPHNIMVGCDGVGRLTDFGVAKAEDRLTHTREGQVKGKLSYMAPEHASTGETDSRSDLFSAGVILWEALTGRRLFRAENAAATLNKILHAPIPLPSTADPALAPLDAVLSRALSRDPGDRFQSADAFAAALEKVAPEVGDLARRRDVGALVNRLADSKLRRDRALIMAASSGGSQLSGEVLKLDVEVSAINLTARSQGEPRSSATMPGGPAARRRQQSLAGVQGLVPPPAAGALNAAPRPGRFHFGKRASVLVVGLSAFAAMLWATHSRDSVRVVPLGGAAEHASSVTETSLPRALQAQTAAYVLTDMNAARSPVVSPVLVDERTAIEGVSPLAPPLAAPLAPRLSEASIPEAPKAPTAVRAHRAQAAAATPHAQQTPATQVLPEVETAQATDLPETHSKLDKDQHRRRPLSAKDRGMKPESQQSAAKSQSTPLVAPPLSPGELLENPYL